MKTQLSRPILVALALLAGSTSVHPGAFVVADEGSPDIRTHARNFAGFGGDLEPIRVCMDIEANQAMAVQAEPALRKAIATINRFRSLGDHTLAFGAATDVPSGQMDFESVLLHELLHTHGLAHPNHADEAGLPGAQSEGTRSADGPNNVFNQLAGADGLHGSADDLRGDDINLHWYQKGVNNPGVLPAIADDSSYARALNFLPGGHLFPANADRQVLAALGFVSAEAVANQGASVDESQRHLQHDDIATLRFARAGLDGIQGTADDYRTQLVYMGRALNPQGEACQIAVRFDTGTAFATSSLGGYRLSDARPNHWALYFTRMRFNPSVNWYFSPGPNTVTTILSDLPDASVGLAPITVRVRLSKAAGNPIAAHPLGVIEVRDGPRHDPSTAFCSITLAGTADEIGECQLTPLRTGNKTLVADYLGYGGFDGGSDSESHTSSGALEFSAISATPNPAAVGALVGINWTLAPPAGQPSAAATGTVTVKDAADCASPALDPAHQCAVSLPASSCSMRFNSVGNKQLQFCYSGDGAHPSVSATRVQQVIAGRITSTTITSNLPNPSVPLSPVQVQLTVRETPDLGGFPSGLVQVLDGPASDPLTARCNVNLAGSAGEVGSCTLHPLRAGARSLSASYGAQAIWAASSGSATQAVASFAIVRNQPATSRLQQGVHVTVNLDVSPFLGAPAPSGTITVSDGIDQCLIVLPASECLWFGHTPGARNLVASWPGDGNYPARTSAAVLQTVLPSTFPQLLSNPLSGNPSSDAASSSGAQTLSADGRFVVFASTATQLVSDDSNAVSDVFIRDQRSGLVRRISTSASGAQANGASREPAISANGRFVAFSSLASNLLPGDTNNVVDVFVKDLSDGGIVRATLKSDGSQDTTPNDFFTDLEPSLSADGRYIAFMTGGQLSPLDTSVHNDIYVRDLLSGALDLVSSNSSDVIGDFRSFSPAISADGRYVAFQSQAFNFAANDNNETTDVWRKDRATRQLAFVSTNASGAGGLDPGDFSFSPAISADGRYVAFTSSSEHLVAGDVNNNPDVFVKDVETGAIQQASSSSTGVGGNNVSEHAAISADGRYVVFRSASSNLLAGDSNSLSDIFLKDRQTQLVTRINLNPGGVQALGGASERPAISADGRFVSYQSAATNLVALDNNAQIDVFVRDRQATASTRASAAHPGARVDGSSGEAGLSRDGSIAVFASAATTLVNADSNGFSDIFAREVGSGSVSRINLPASGTPQANGASDSPAISGDGLWVVFRSAASNLVSGDSNAAHDLFVKQRLTGAIERISTDSGGAQLGSAALRAGTAISQDGNLVVFQAGDSNLVTGDSNGFDDVLLKNRASGSTRLISVKSDGTLGNGHSSRAQISTDGSVVVFVSSASNLVADDSNGQPDVFAKLPDGSLLRVSSSAAGQPGNGASGNPSVSSNGRLVVFTSSANNLVAADNNGLVDVFAADLHSGSIQRISTSAAGVQGSGGDCSGATSISGDGRYAGFSCAMDNLVAGDSNALADSFVKDLLGGAISRVSVNASSVQADAVSGLAAGALSDNGFVAFSSAASNLVPVHETSDNADVYLAAFATAPPITTSTVISSHTPNPSPRDGSYLVSVSVTRSSGSADVRGTVRISEGSTSCLATLSGSGASATGQCALQAFTVGSKTLNARYGGDQQHAASDAASVSHSVLPIAPFAPTIGTASAGNGEVLVVFTAPADNGGLTILSYTASCGASSALGQSSPITVSGLANGVAVSCTVLATNAVGNSTPSAPSNSVTPSTAQTVVGPFAYVPRNNTGQMAVVDLGSNTIVASINLGAGIGIAVAPNGQRAYAIEQAFNTVRVINTQTRTLVTSIPVGAGPWSAVVSPDSTRLYVSNRNASTVSVIDTASNTVTATFNVAAAPTGLAISPDGSTLYVGSANTLNLSVVALPSLAVNQVNVGTTPQGLAISPDGSRVYFSNGQVTGQVRAFDTVSNAVVGTLNVGGVPLGLSISPDGSRLYVSNNGGNGNVNGNTVWQIDAATLSVLASGPTGPRPLGVDVHPDGSRVYVGNSNGTLSVLSSNGMTPLATLDLGSSDAIYALGNFIARPSAPGSNRKLAVGAITLPATGTGANLATRVVFPQPFLATPVVIAMPDDADADPKAVRIANINGSGFDLLQLEPRGCPGCTGAGGAMTVHWLAALPGVYRLANDVPNLRRGAAPTRALGPGIVVKVGSVSTMASQRASLLGGFVGFPAASWQSVSFPVAAGHTFSAPPVVLTGLQSWNPANTENGLALPVLPARPSLTGVSRLWFTSAVRNVSASGFDTALESSGSDNTGAARPGLYNPETIGYVAIESGVSTQLSSVGGALIGLATVNSAGTGTGCPVTTLFFPSGSVFNAANLRGFAGLHSRGEDDGGWLRRCTLSSPGGTSINLGVRVDEDADLSADRSHPTSEAIGTAVFGGDFATTPVSLAFVSAQRIGEQLDVQFSSASEIAHLGYRIWGRSAEARDWTPLHNDLIVNAGGDSMSARSYQRRLNAPDITQIRIEDVDLQGSSRFHPALSLDTNGRTAMGSPALDRPLDWAAIRAVNRSTSIAPQRGSGPASVLAAVTRSGIQRLSQAQLLAAGFTDVVAVADLAVLENGVPVPRYVECGSALFGPGCFVEWLGRTRPGLYGSERIYAITSSAASVRSVATGALVERDAVARSHTAQIEHAPNRAYALSAPGNDPWYDERLVATSAPAQLSRSFTLPGRVAGPVNLSVDLWGGLDYAGVQHSAADHSVELLLNGQRVASHRFDGLGAERISVNLRDDQLLASNNTLTVRLPADTGYAADVVLLDGYTLSYTRSSTLSDGELAFGEFATAATATSSQDRLLQDGLESRTGFNVDGINTTTVIWSQLGDRISRDQVSANAALDSRVSAVHLVDFAHLQTPTLQPAAAPEIDLSSTDYLIVSHPLFADQLQPLITLQQSRGYRVRVLRTDAIFAARSQHQRSPQAIGEVIAQINPRFVLLVGGDSYDYDDNLGLRSQSFLPTFYRASSPLMRFAASDAPYADANDDGIPERALGRIPARTIAELRNAIAAILERGNTPVSRYFAAAGGSTADEHFDTHSRALLSYLRQDQITTFAAVDELGLAQAQLDTTGALAGGSDWINYLGHSSPNRWAVQGLLDSSQLTGIQRSGPPAIISQWGCWSSYFALPGQDTMSQALLSSPNHLAAAVIGSTSLAENASHLALATRFFDLIEDGRIDDRGGVAINTLGEALSAAKADLARRAPEHIESNYSITLFGDPAMVVR